MKHGNIHHFNQHHAASGQIVFKVPAPLIMVEADGGVPMLATEWKIGHEFSLQKEKHPINGDWDHSWHVHLTRRDMVELIKELIVKVAELDAAYPPGEIKEKSNAED